MTARTALPVDAGPNDVRMDGVFFRSVAVEPPFAHALESGNFSYCVMVRAGMLRFETDFPVATRIDLREGDVIGVSGLAPHVFCAPEGARCGPVTTFNLHPLPNDGAHAHVQFVVGIAPNEALALGSLVLGPIVVRPDQQPALSRRLWRAVEMLEDEYADPSWTDGDLVVRRMAEVMLVNMTRRAIPDHITPVREADNTAPSRQLLVAVDAFFDEPDRAWTLADLARTAGMSRTRFVEAFKQVTGQTPWRIISRIRLATVARRLASEPLSVEAAAEAAGYSSAAAFVRAFQREFGETPARWRRQRRQAAETRPDDLRSWRAADPGVLNETH